MFTQYKLFTIFIILMLLPTACNQQGKSILPVQAPFDEETQAKADKLDKFFQTLADDGGFSGRGSKRKVCLRKSSSCHFHEQA